MGYQDFTNGNTLPDTSLDEMSKQGVLKYASAAARDGDAALTAALREGMICYLDSTDSLYVYTGSAWARIGTVHGASITGWTPAIVQLGAVTATVNRSSYVRFGRRIFGDCYMTVTGTGTGANIVTVSLPVTASSSSGQTSLGVGGIFDASSGHHYNGIAAIASTTTLRLRALAVAGAGDQYLGTHDFTAALAAGDIVNATFNYEAAAD